MTRRHLAQPALALLLALALACSLLLSSCEESEKVQKRTSSISDASIIRAFEEVLLVPRSGKDYPDRINEYLMRHGKELGLDCKTDKVGNVIMDAPATTGYEDLPRTLLQVHTDDLVTHEPDIVFDASLDNVDLSVADGVLRGKDTSMGASSAFGIASILTILAHPGSHGPLRAIFTAHADEDAHGAAGLSKKSLEGNLLISFDGLDRSRILTGAPTATVLTSSTTVAAMQPEKQHAFVLAAAGFSGGRADIGKDAVNGDPIRVVTDILTRARSAGILIELCSFQAEADSFDLPKEAVATVIVGDYEQRMLRRIVGEVQRDARDRYGDAAEGIEVSMIETVPPEASIDNDSMSTVLAHLYGLLNNNIATSAAKETAALYISSVDLSPQHFFCSATLYAADPAEIDTIVTQQLALEKLTGIPMQASASWTGFRTETEEDTVVQAFLDAADKELEGSPEHTVGNKISELGLLHEKAPDLPIVVLGAGITDKGTPAESIEEKGIADPANAALSYILG
ncbi:MAG: hypothetical protein LBD12_06235 [Clostridiales Family XIII bacterium]|jgi:dipeptidase D|nr:hypothetical protein [Clostridiales Family XIII bacterium]